MIQHPLKEQGKPGGDIEIIPADKLKVGTSVHDGGEQFLVCVRDAKGRLVFITELTRYLEEERGKSGDVGEQAGR